MICASSISLHFSSLEIFFEFFLSFSLPRSVCVCECFSLVLLYYVNLLVLSHKNSHNLSIWWPSAARCVVDKEREKTKMWNVHTCVRDVYARTGSVQSVRCVWWEIRAHAPQRTPLRWWCWINVRWSFSSCLSLFLPLSNSHSRATNVSCFCSLLFFCFVSLIVPRWNGAYDFIFLFDAHSRTRDESRFTGVFVSMSVCVCAPVEYARSQTVN